MPKFAKKPVSVKEHSTIILRIVLSSLLDLMGHEEAMIAMLTEKETWHDICTALTDMWCEVIRKTIRYYKPDIIMMADDMGFGQGPFMSVDTYREMIKSYMARMVKEVRDGGCYMHYHSCGKVELPKTGSTPSGQ